MLITYLEKRDFKEGGRVRTTREEERALRFVFWILRIRLNDLSAACDLQWVLLPELRVTL
jgi:hypothetical protein